MSTDDLPPIESDGSDDDVVDPAIAGPLRVLLAADVEDSIATDAAWGDIEREAAGRRAQRTRGRSILVAALAVAAVLAVVLVVRIESGREEPQDSCS